MDDKRMISDELLDYFREVFNIGAGNAAVALSQLLKCEVEMKIPRLHIVKSIEEAQMGGETSSNLSGAIMSLVGDAQGNVFFLIPIDAVKGLISHIENTYPFRNRSMPEKESRKLESSVVMEVSNIIIGVYLTAMGRISILNIYHSVPRIVKGDLMSIFKNHFPHTKEKGMVFISVVNEFYVKGTDIQSKSLIVAHTRDIAPLIDSIKEAQRMMRG